MRNQSTPAVPARDRAGAAAIRKQVLLASDRFFRPTDFSAPPSTTRHILSDLTASGDLIRVRRGLYWRGRVGRFGMSHPRAEQIVRAIAGSAGVGPSGFSAANLLGISTQVPRHSEYAITGRAPTPLPRIRFESRPGHTGRVTQKLTECEVALLEVLGSLDTVSEMSPDQALSRLIEEIVEGRVRADRLARASATEPTSVRVRLNVLLRAAGRASLAALVLPQDGAPVAGLCPAWSAAAELL